MAFEERYYREELDYLRQLGKLLAQEKPHLAHFLAEKEGDPDVERLMEAFAFMSGSLRQKLEDEFPRIHPWANPYAVGKLFTPGSGHDGYCL